MSDADAATRLSEALIPRQPSVPPNAMSPMTGGINHPSRFLASPASRAQLFASPLGSLSGGLRPSFPGDEAPSLGPLTPGRSCTAVATSLPSVTPSPSSGVAAARPGLSTGYFAGNPPVSSSLAAAAAPAAPPANSSATHHKPPSSAGNAAAPSGPSNNSREASVSSGGGGSGSGGGGGGGGERGESGSNWQAQLREDVLHAAALVEAAARHRSAVAQPLGQETAGRAQEPAGGAAQQPAAPESLGCVRRMGAVNPIPAQLPARLRPPPPRPPATHTCAHTPRACAQARNPARSRNRKRRRARYRESGRPCLNLRRFLKPSGIA